MWWSDWEWVDYPVVAPARYHLVLANGHIYVPPGSVDSPVEQPGIASYPARAVTRYKEERLCLAATAFLI